MKTLALLAAVAAGMTMVMLPALQAEPALADLAISLKEAPPAVADSTLHWLLGNIVPDKSLKAPPRMVITGWQSTDADPLPDTPSSGAIPPTTTPIPSPAAPAPSAPTSASSIAWVLNSDVCRFLTIFLIVAYFPILWARTFAHLMPPLARLKIFLKYSSHPI